MRDGLCKPLGNSSQHRDCHIRLQCLHRSATTASRRLVTGRPVAGVTGAGAARDSTPQFQGSRPRRASNARADALSRHHLQRKHGHWCGAPAFVNALHACMASGPLFCNKAAGPPVAMAQAPSSSTRMDPLLYRSCPWPSWARVRTIPHLWGFVVDEALPAQHCRGGHRSW